MSGFGFSGNTFGWLFGGGGTGGSGTVTSVGLTMPSSDFDVANSPVTTSGTLAVTYKTQTQNLVFASPNGSTGVPTFRALTTNDLPNTVGTVKSVGLTMPSSDFDVANSPVTTSGTLAVTYKTQTQNLFFASPNGSTGVPTFRALVASDLPSALQEEIFTVCCNFPNLAAPADNTNYFFGAQYTAAIATGGTARIIFIPVNCTLVGYSITIVYTAGSAEASQIYMRIDNTTDVQLGGNFAGTNNITTSAFNVSQDVDAGSYVNIKWTTPNWTTNPANATGTVILYFKRR